MLGVTVREANGLAHLLSHANFLARTVDEVELTLREENSKGDTGEPTTCAEIEDAGARTETDDLGDGERVKHMVLVELVDVFTGYDIDLRVPLVIKVMECLYIRVSSSGTIRESGSSMP